MQGLAGAKSTGKWQTLSDRGNILQADLVAISETHHAQRQADRFARAAAGAGWPGYFCNPGTGRALGTAILGPKVLREDPFDWPDCLRGRISSSVLPCGTMDILVISVYLPVGTGAALQQREQCISAIANRIALADLPCLVAGDWNCSPHSPELAPLSSMCSYAQELVGVEYKSTKDHCIDFCLVKNLTVQQVAVDLLISDHRAVFVQCHLPSNLQYDALRRFPNLTTDAAAWQTAWETTWPSWVASWAEAKQNNDVETMWRVWSSALELAGGIQSPQRHFGTVVEKIRLVWKGPTGSRMNCRQRRLHRVWRRAHEQILQLDKGNFNPQSFERLLRDVRRLEQIGLLEFSGSSSTSDLHDIERELTRAISAANKRIVEDRYAQWVSQAKAPGMAKLFDCIGGKVRPGLQAVLDSNGSPTADPSTLQKHAQDQWNRKIHPALEPERRAAYLNRVLPFISMVHVETSVDDPFSVEEFCNAVRGCQGTAPGPTQWSAEVLLTVPREALSLLVQLMQVICHTGKWPSALRFQEVTMIPKRPGSGDLRPISVTSIITRAFEKMVLERYKSWVVQVQPTDVVDTLLAVEVLVADAQLHGTSRIFRQSDLSNCFTRLDVDICKQLAIAFGMRPAHAAMLFEINRRRPAIVRAGAAVGEWQFPDRGMAQGDPISPLAAALVAGAHARCLRACVPGIEFHTYVDDRTLSCTCPRQARDAITLLNELDDLSGQAEDPAKEEFAGINLQDDWDTVCPRVNKDFLDLLGIRVHFSDGSFGIAPKAHARWTELEARLKRLQTLSRGMRLSRDQIGIAVKATLGLLQWDAAWLVDVPTGLRKMTTLIENVLQGRRRHAAWRHRGAAWLVQQRGWQLDPQAIIWWSQFFLARKARFSSWRATLERAWQSSDGFMGRFCSRLRTTYISLGLGITSSPFIFDHPAGLCDIGLVSNATLGHILRQDWRAAVMKQCANNTRRHVCVDIPSIDVAPLHSFLNEKHDDNPALSWRCVTAAEPNLERLAHVINVEKGCSFCPGNPVATTFHHMWECVQTASLRSSFGLDFSVLTAGWFGATSC